MSGRNRLRTRQEKLRIRAGLIRRFNRDLGPANRNRRFKVCSKCGVKKYRKRFSMSARRRDGLNGWCKDCMKRISKKYLKSKAKQSRAYRAALRLEVLRHYSEKEIPECACCLISFLEFLGIDHINGGGAKHKREVVGAHLYIWLKKNGFPKGFRVLCHNCNQSFGAYGYCPHDKS
jgi:hypothetical protein